jgi:D-apionate oxidoisomerase
VNSASLTVTVVGAGGKMGMRVSNNLEPSPYRVFYAENHPPAMERVRAAGRELSDTNVAVAQSDVIVMAVPDILLGKVSEGIVAQAKPGAVLLTLDPAALYAGLIAHRDDMYFAVAHPCHPSVFLQRKSSEEWADTFGGIAAPQDVVAALESGDQPVRDRTEEVIRTIYSPVLDVHWVTVKQLTVLEPTVTETITCMISGLLKDVLREAVSTAGIPEPAVKAMLFGHVQIALANSLLGSNAFSDAAMIAMGYGREKVVKHDWAKIFDDAELDTVIARMLQLESVHHTS